MNNAPNIILSCVGLSFAAAIGLEILYTAALLEFLIYAAWRNRRILFYYRAARIVTYVLYLSFYWESGLYMSNGGDDFSFYSRHLTKDYSFDEIFSGVFFNFPWFYLVNKYLISLVPNVPSEYVVVYLASFNNVIWALIAKKYHDISRMTGSNRGHLIWWFTPMLFTSSILLRDIWIYFCFISVYQLHLANKLTFRRFAVYILISFFTRPESGVLILIFVLSTNFKKSLLIYVAAILWIFSFTDLNVLALFRDYEVLQEIYFSNKDVANINESGIAIRLMNIEGLLGSIIWMFYNLFKPLPPIVFSHFSVGNLMLLFGNIFNYVIVLYFIMKSIRMPKMLLNREFLFFIIGIGIVSFIGGTQRHTYHFLIPILLLFGRENKLVRFSFYRAVALSPMILIPIYLLLL